MEQGVSVWTPAYLLGVLGRIQMAPYWRDIFIHFFKIQMHKIWYKNDQKQNKAFMPWQVRANSISSIDRCKASSSGNCKVVVGLAVWECSLSSKHNWKAGVEKLLCHLFFPLVPLRMKGHKILQYEQSKYSYSRESWTQFSCRIGHKKTFWFLLFLQSYK